MSAPALKLVTEWMTAHGYFPPQKASLHDLLEALVEQAAEHARASGYDEGYETAKENYSQDDR